MATIPRRNYLSLSTPAEIAINNAHNEIEKLGADERLTKAQVLLTEAKKLISDFVDDTLQILKT